MRIVETGNLRFIENEVISGSLEPCKVEIQEVRVEISSSITSSQVVPVVVDYLNNPQEEQINGQTPHYDVITNEHVTKRLQEKVVKICKAKKLAIFYDYGLFA